jgi:hypothetical protein
VSRLNWLASGAWFWRDSHVAAGGLNRAGDRIEGMIGLAPIELYLWIAICLAVALKVWQFVEYNRWRFSIFDLLAFTFLAAVMLAVGRTLISL